MLQFIRNSLVLLCIGGLFAQSSLAAVQQPQPQQKEWTFLVYINGHNNLSSYADMNLKDMEKTGSTNNLNVVVEWGSTKTKITKRMLITKSTNPSQVTSPVLMQLQNHDMGDYNNLIDFIKWGVQNYPAKHYFIAVWNHGSGWHLMDQRGGIQLQDISYDDYSGNHITTEQLGLVMAEAKAVIGHNVDIYGSDACLMQMIEVAAEMKDSVDFMVGSQEVEPGEGWPYAPFLQKWSAMVAPTAEDVSRLLTKEYTAAYSGGVYGDSDVTFAALRIQALDPLYEALKNMAVDLGALDNVEFASVKQAVTYSQSFTYSDYVDLGDFMLKLNGLPIAQKLQKSISDAKLAYETVILETANSANFNRATGLSIWLPTGGESLNMQRYSQLKFNLATNWISVAQRLNDSPN